MFGEETLGHERGRVGRGPDLQQEGASHGLAKHVVLDGASGLANIGESDVDAVMVLHRAKHSQTERGRRLCVGCPRPNAPRPTP